MLWPLIKFRSHRFEAQYFGFEGQETERARQHDFDCTEFGFHDPCRIQADSSSLVCHLETTKQH